ncbi:MAG: recombination regulator RecX [Clostridiales bacterium]|jgi:regulatory protein|nr:recombination regulator RecX [Clostridiales bacterium]
MIAPDFDRARDFAVRYLSHAPRTRKQMQDRLAAKEFSPEAARAVIQLLTEMGYLNDIALAQNYISAKTRLNNYGRRRIAAALSQKGVAKEDIQAAYDAILQQDDHDEAEAARRALTKRLARKDITEIVNDPKEMQRLASFLMRRGFSYDIVKSVLKNQLEEETS